MNLNYLKILPGMLFAVLFLTLLTACEKDIYNPIIPENPEIEIDWSTQKTTRLNVDVNDAYAGVYYYTVSAYLSNPAIDPQTRMIAGSGQKTNSKVGYSRLLVLPDMTETVYISVTDPFKRRRIYAAEVEGETISFRAAPISTKSGVMETRASDIPAIDFTYGTDYEELSGSNYTSLKKGMTYVVKAGKTFSGNMDFPGEGTFKLYVEGALEWNGSATRMEKAAELYILNGGVVKNKSSVRSLTLNNALLAVQAGGTFGDEAAGADFSITMTNTSKIVNEGLITVKSITMNSEASFYNAGTFRFDKLNTENATNAIVNTHLIEAGEISLRNATIVNDCMIVVDVFRVLANGTVKLSSGSYMQSKETVAAGLTLEMKEQSMWETTKVTFGGQVSNVKGVGTDYALFKATDVVINPGGTALKYDGLVEIECQSHTENGTYNIRYTMTNGAAFAVGQASADIPGSDCNGQGGNDNDGEGEGDTDGGFKEESTIPYTYMFEDNWPLKGDYDMNDVVISVELRNITQQAKTKGVRIIADLLAVGGTKKLAAGYQLDGFAASTVSGAEAGQEYAVFTLFADAHAELGAPSGKIANTYSIDYPAKRIEKEILFNTPVDGVVNVNNFNLFIVVDGNMGGKERAEVHLPGFVGTNFAKKDARSTTRYVEAESGWMWALAIPQVEFASYPLEGVQVNNAYEGFTDWVAGSGVPGWYMNPIEGKVIHLE